MAISCSECGGFGQHYSTCPKVATQIYSITQDAPAERQLLCRATIKKWHPDGRECKFKASRDGFCEQHHPDKILATKLETMKVALARLQDAENDLHDYKTIVWEPFNEERMRYVR